MKIKSTMLFVAFMLCHFMVIAQDIELLEQFSGKIDFTMIGNTLNPADNSINNPCTINTSSSASLNLTSGDTVEAAYLYWSGSGSGDLEVMLNGIAITAERTFSDTVSGRPVFGAYADVTTQVQTTGNGNYTLSELDLRSVISASAYCNNGTNYGGWAILIVLENDILPINQINLYDGMQGVDPNAGISTLTIQIDNIDVIDNTDAKVAFLAWEGDLGISVQETLKVNGFTLSNPPLNPSNNAFNSTNSFNNSSNLYNMDLDVYDVENYIDIGDTSANIQLDSGQDFVLINAVMVKLNTELPDATVNISDVQFLTCNDRELSINFEVFNINDSGTIPANTPITIYADGVFVATFFTQNDIIALDSETFTENINIPLSVANEFELTIVVDDDGTGNGTILEINEDNNTDTTTFETPQVPIANEVEDQLLCDDEPDSLDGISSFDTSEIENILLGGVGEQSSMEVFYFDELGNALSSPLPNPFVTTSQEISVLIQNPLDTTCQATTTINFVVIPFPIANNVSIERQCDDDQNGLIFFDISTIENDVLQGQTNVSLTYFNEDGSQILPTLPNPFETTSQTITIVATNDLLSDCTDITTLAFTVDQLPVANSVETQFTCDDAPNDTDGISNFDTSNIQSIILQDQTGMEVFYFDELGNSLPSPLPNPFETHSQTITVVVENPINNICQASTTINFHVEPLPVFDIFDDIICIDSFPESVTVFIENPEADYDYAWFNELNENIGNLNQLEIFESGNYSVIATSQILSDCTTTKFFNISETVVEFNQPNNFLLCDEGFNQAIFDLEETFNQITTNPDLEVSFFTNTEDLHANNNEITNSNGYTNTSNPQTIYARVENSITNCYNFTTFKIEVYNCIPIIPNAFTPNNQDDDNATFYLEDVRDIFENFEIYIYNRYGNLIFEGNNNKPAWNGTYKGEEMSVGTYFYHLHLHDPLYSDINGWVYLNR